MHKGPEFIEAVDRVEAHCHGLVRPEVVISKEVIHVEFSDSVVPSDGKGIGRFAGRIRTSSPVLLRPATCESTEHPEQPERWSSGFSLRRWRSTTNRPGTTTVKLRRLKPELQLIRVICGPVWFFLQRHESTRMNTDTKRAFASVFIRVDL